MNKLYWRVVLITILCSLPLATSFLIQSTTSSQYQHRTMNTAIKALSSASSTSSADVARRVALTVCAKCRGEGRIRQRPSRKARNNHKRAKRNNEASVGNTSAKPASLMPAVWKPCADCNSTGLMPGKPPSSNTTPSVAIVGGGIGGLALGVALKHRGIHCRIYERDDTFAQRHQGYGLTMQQASKQLKCFGIEALEDGITSTKHVVHRPDGTIVGEWGMRTWNPNAAETQSNNGKKNKRQNVHIARQALRRELLNALGGDSCVEWGCQLLDYTEEDDGVNLMIQRGTNETFTTTADILVGADGIRSAVRNIYIDSDKTPLRYLNCIVILGICPRSDILSESPLMDGETVFQTADGSTRLYAMPYSPTEYMWQLSYPLDEEESKNVSRHQDALKQEALRLCGEWHEPIHELLTATPDRLVSGYPVYDRALLTSDLLTSSRVTLLGDAAHPMSPFKVCCCLSLAVVLYRDRTGVVRITHLRLFLDRDKVPTKHCSIVYPWHEPCIEWMIRKKH